MSTPCCDELAREHMRIKAGADAPGVVQDWIALAQKLERDLADRTEYAGQLKWAALRLVNLSGKAFDMLEADQDMKCLKLLKAMGGGGKGYMADVDEIHAILAKHPNPAGEPATGAQADAAGPVGAGLVAVAGVPCRFCFGRGSAIGPCYECGKPALPQLSNTLLIKAENGANEQQVAHSESLPASKEPMQDVLVKDLRDYAKNIAEQGEHDDAALLTTAADTIERLRSECHAVISSEDGGT